MKQQRTAFFEELVNSYGPKLYNLIRSIVLNHEDANDLLQETMIKAWKGLESFRQEASYATWLYRIALNEALRHQKRASLRRSLQFWQPATQTAQSPAGDVEAVLTAALETLTPRQRSIFALHYFNQLRFDEIAAMLGITEATAKATYHQSANKIRKYIAKYAEQ
ncbi:MAG: RNA polymerase sigma factor [Bacteroidetes bacterium]|nr:RNA polymerase sigma factor [Bacteroidota bacterium]